MSEIEPELRTLRSLARACTDPYSRQDLESARFALYAAFERRDHELSRRWVRACRAMLLSLEVPGAREAGEAALSSIERAIGEDP